MENIQQKIEELSAKNQKNLNHHLANFVLTHLQEVSEWTIDEFAKNAHCSKPSVVRFCKEIGCVGFAEFKFKLKNYLTTKEIQKFGQNSEETIDWLYLETAQKSFREVYTFYKKQKKTITKLIQQISDARLIYIFGTSVSYNFAKAFCDWLRLLGLNVIYEKDSSLIDVYLTHLKEKDLVICFSLPDSYSWLKKIENKLSKTANYKFGILGLNSSMGNLFNDFVVLPEFGTTFWNLGSIRSQALAQFLDYLYFDLSKVISLQK